MRSLPRAGWIVASAASVAMLITNWGLGLAAAFFRLPFRQFLLVSGGAFLLVSAVSAVQMKLLHRAAFRSEEHTSELQSLMRISYAVFCLQKKKKYKKTSLNCR